MRGGLCGVHSSFFSGNQKSGHKRLLFRLTALFGGWLSGERSFLPFGKNHGFRKYPGKIRMCCQFQKLNMWRGCRLSGVFTLKKPNCSMKRGVSLIDNSGDFQFRRKKADSFRVFTGKLVSKAAGEIKFVQIFRF